LGILYRVVAVYLFVTTECPVLIGIFEGFSWIRCEGKGSFLNSPVLKQLAHARIAEGETCLVVDLAACTGMDSTFMGILGGIASRLKTQNKGVLQIAEAADRNRRSLEDLGLDFFMEINPANHVWPDDVASIRASLKKAQAESAPTIVQRAEHVLEAHQTLAQTNEKNAQVFSGVIDQLQQDLLHKKPESDQPSES
jgi:anti-sigma B factor antagonist